MMVKVLRFWWQNDSISDFVETVTNIWNLSPTSVTNIIVTVKLVILTKEVYWEKINIANVFKQCVQTEIRLEEEVFDPKFYR